MNTTLPIPEVEVTRLIAYPEGRRDAEPIEDTVMSDAEEEELAELWACDRGNQGA